MQRTAHGIEDLAPGFGHPASINIDGPIPFGEDIWQGGGIGFRLDDDMPMRN